MESCRDKLPRVSRRFDVLSRLRCRRQLGNPGFVETNPSQPFYVPEVQRMCTRPFVFNSLTWISFKVAPLTHGGRRPPVMLPVER